MRTARHPSRGIHPALVFAFIFRGAPGSAAPLLRLPYFWDEAGYYVPAARDLLLTGSLIPHSTPSNAHPPLVMAYLALWWKMAGFAPVVTRTAMLLAASFSLLGLFRLAETVANMEVAVGDHDLYRALSCVLRAKLSRPSRSGRSRTYILGSEQLREAPNLANRALVLARSPGQRDCDPGAAGFVRLGTSCRCCCSGRNVVGTGVSARQRKQIPRSPGFCFHSCRLRLVRLPLLRTGLVFGNPEFFRYNVEGTLQPLRILLALLIRLWQTFGYFHLLLLTLAALFAMWLPPLRDENGERPRIAWMRSSPCSL